jgi:hypothetical protein
VSKVETPVAPVEPEPAAPVAPTPAPVVTPQARKAPAHQWDAHKTEANGLTIYNFAARSE